MAHLRTLSLTNFRSYDAVDLRDLHDRFVVLTGANGAGKTNILEAVSLLTAGKGLRNAGLSDIANMNAPSGAPWGVSANVTTIYGEMLLGTGAHGDTARRDIFIQGVKAKSQTELQQYLRCVWLTPQMDRLFIDPTTSRRKFLDRLVFTYDEAHAGRMRRYETALTQRSRLLKDGVRNGAWLDSLESQMAESASAIAASRVDFIGKLQVEINADDGTHFPRARLELDGDVERDIHQKPSVQIEDELKERWKSLRDMDAAQGGSQLGVHRTDLKTFFATKNMAADVSSTGEQKILLIGIILSHARFLTSVHNEPPIILFDEVAAHLDEQRRDVLYQKLEQLGTQVFLTGTDLMLFDGIKNGQKFSVKTGGQISL
jgi:DNA replication and repair protein RecF